MDVFFFESCDMFDMESLEIDKNKSCPEEIWTNVHWAFIHVMDIL